MARRNSRQSRKAKRELAIRQLAAQRNPSTVADTGHVRNSTSSKAHMLNEHGGIAYSNRAPKPFLWEGQGKSGVKVVKGKVVRKLPAKSKPNVEPLGRVDFLKGEVRLIQGDTYKRKLSARHRAKVLKDRGEA